LQIIEDAIAKGLLKEGGYICEGSGGNTGVAIAMLAAAMGLKSFIAVPENTSPEKI
jgi:cysteine synthase A